MQTKCDPLSPIRLYMREAVERNPHEWGKIHSDARIGEFVSKTVAYIAFRAGNKSIEDK